MPQQPTKVFLTGGSGFVGTHVLHELLRQGHEVRALVRHAGVLKINDPRVTCVIGSISDAISLQTAAQGCDAAIHLVGIIFEGKESFFDIHTQGTKNVVDACRQGGVQRYVHMSAQGTRADAVSNYHKSKWQAEEYVRASGLAYTIFRPSMIYGPGGEFTRMLRNWSLGKAPPFLFMPYFGEGFFGQHNQHRISPVYVGDVARAFLDALKNEQSIGKTYSVGGPESFTWKQLLSIASRKFRGKPKASVGIPAWLAKIMTALHLQGLPFNRDQVIMALEDNTTDNAALLRDFPQIQLQKFAEKLSVD